MKWKSKKMCILVLILLSSLPGLNNPIERNENVIVISQEDECIDVNNFDKIKDLKLLLL